MMSSPMPFDRLDPVWLRRYIATHSGFETLTDAHWLPFVGTVLFCCGTIALTPPTPRWKLFRAALLPIYLGVGAHFCLFTVGPSWSVHWGNITGHQWHAMKAIEVLLFYPVEEYCYRVRPITTKGEKGEVIRVEAEEVPPPRTLAKLWWTLSVWFSQRGVGWNFCAPLPDSSRSHPFTRTSTRKAFLINRAMYLGVMWFVCDLARSYMTFGPGAAFFEGRPGIAPSYDSLTLVQRALYSVPISARIVWSIEEWYTPISLVMVTIGGVLGWEGEWWSPWGWPPLFGSIKDLWIHPGLGHMWSKTWHQYFHHWLSMFGWLGIGETILRLPRSGISSRPKPAISSLTTPSSDDDSSNTSTRAPSPAHPLPTTPSPRRASSGKMMAANFTKSLIVFTLTGLYHDLPTYLLQLHTASGLPIPLSSAFATTFFFLLQPFALALEAAVKRYWRGWKDTAHPEWAKGTREPGWLVTAERTVGFVWTWWWFGHTARYFVVGLTQAGLYLRRPGQPGSLSPMGGVVYGQWWH